MDYIRSSSYHFSKNKKNIQFFDAPDKFTNDFKKLGGRYYSKKGMWTFPASIILHEVGNDEKSAMEEEEQVDVNGDAMEEEQVDVNGDAMEEEQVDVNGDAMEEEEVDVNGDAMEEEEEVDVNDADDISAMEDEEEVDVNGDVMEEEEVIEQITVDGIEEEEEVIEQITVDGMEEEEQVEAKESNTYLSEECSIDANEHTDYHSVITIDHDDTMQEAATTIHAIDIDEEVIELDGDIEDDEEDSVLELENVDYYNIDCNLEHKANQSKDHYVIDIINDEYEYDANSHKVAQTPTIHERDRISKEDALYINETLVRSTNKYKIYPSDQFYDIIANYKKLVQLKEK